MVELLGLVALLDIFLQTIGLFNFLANFLRYLRATEVFFLCESFFSALESLYFMRLSLSIAFLA